MLTIKEKACGDYCFSQPEDIQLSIGEDLAQAFDAGWDAAQKNFVHDPDNPEGITTEELKHQLYGADFARKQMLEKFMNYLRKKVNQNQIIYHKNTWMKLEDFINDARKELEGYI